MKDKKSRKKPKKDGALQILGAVRRYVRTSWEGLKGGVKICQVVRFLSERPLWKSLEDLVASPARGTPSAVADVLRTDRRT